MLKNKVLKMYFFLVRFQNFQAMSNRKVVCTFKNQFHSSDFIVFQNISDPFTELIFSLLSKKLVPSLQTFLFFSRIPPVEMPRTC